MSVPSSRAAPNGAGGERSHSPFSGLHVALVAAHQDDEVLSAGGQMSAMGHLSLIHLTDGAVSRGHARDRGFTTRSAYARARERELEAALRHAITPMERTMLGFRDQQLPLNLVEAVLRLVDLVSAIAPDIVLTHPYEGGHPDHDAAAFATALAVRLSGLSVPIWEMASYHRSGSGIVFGEFLPHPEAPVMSMRLATDACNTKRQMLECFASQQDAVQQFPIGIERFRPAPRYDFHAPPHPGRLLYETGRRAWRGTDWRRFALRAERALSGDPRKRQVPAFAESLHRPMRAFLWSCWLAP